MIKNTFFIRKLANYSETTCFYRVFDPPQTLFFHRDREYAVSGRMQRNKVHAVDTLTRLTEEILQVKMSGCSWPNFYSNVSQRVFLTDPPSPKFNVGATPGSGNLQNFFRSKAPPITTPLACRPNLELGGCGG